MTPKLYALLVLNMEEWMALMGEEENLPVATFWGDQTNVLMAKAAACVFDAVVEAQATAIDNGNLEECQ